MSNELKKAAKAEKKAAKANRSKGRKGEKAFKVIIAILLVVAIVGELYIGFTIKGELANLSKAVNASSESESDNAVSGIEFKPGTYGGKEFKEAADVVNYYNEVYNKTKAKTKVHTAVEGSDSWTFYEFLGDEKLQIKEGSLLIDGKSNSMVDGLVGPILTNIFKPNVNGLPPCASRDPLSDIDSKGNSLATSRVVPEDVATCSVVDNGDGTITLTLVPVSVNLSEKGMDAQGHFFNSLGAIDKTLQDVGVTFSSGTIEENCKVMYETGKAVVKVDVASGEMVEADYNMVVNINLTHASIAVLKDRGAALTILYDNHFPASDEALAERGFKR
ncbi:MAG: hypothetical protein K1V95_05595 [Eubacterium sp.]